MPRGRRREPSPRASCSFHLVEAALRLVRVLALGELGDDALEVQPRLRLSSQAGERGAEVVEDRVTLAVIRILLHDSVQSLDRCEITASLDVEAGHDVLVFGQTIGRFLQPLLRFRTKRARSEE